MNYALYILAEKKIQNMKIRIICKPAFCLYHTGAAIGCSWCTWECPQGFHSRGLCTASHSEIKTLWVKTFLIGIRITATSSQEEEEWKSTEEETKIESAKKKMGSDWVIKLTSVQHQCALC